MENLEMKDRIAHIIRAKNLTAAEFALRLGIQPSNISHLLSGRNNPSLEFVKKLKETFPEYSLEWIVFGRGPVTISEPFSSNTPIEPDSTVLVHENPMESMPKGTTYNQPLDDETQLDQSPTSSTATLKRILLVYSDNTFEQILPR